LKKRTKKLLFIWDTGRGAATAPGPDVEAFFARFFAKKRRLLPSSAAAHDRIANHFLAFRTATCA
jgi:hypothetical protein